MSSLVSEKELSEQELSSLNLGKAERRLGTNHAECKPPSTIMDILMDALTAQVLSGDVAAMKQLWDELSCMPKEVAKTRIKREWLDTPELWSLSAARDLIFDCCSRYECRFPEPSRAFVLECIAQKDNRFTNALTSDLLEDETTAQTIYAALETVSVTDALRVIDDHDTMDAECSFAKPLVRKLLNRATPDMNLQLLMNVWHKFEKVDQVTADTATSLLNKALQKPDLQGRALDIVQAQPLDTQIKLLPALALLAASCTAKSLPLSVHPARKAQDMMRCFLRDHGKHYCPVLSEQIADAVRAAPWHSYVSDLPHSVCEHLLSLLATQSRLHVEKRDRIRITQKLSEMLARRQPGTPRFQKLLEAFVYAKPTQEQCMFLRSRLPPAQFDDLMSQFVQTPVLVTNARAVVSVQCDPKSKQVAQFESNVAQLPMVPLSFEGVLADQVMQAYKVLFKFYNKVKDKSVCYRCEDLLRMLCNATVCKCVDRAQVTRVLENMDRFIVLTSCTIEMLLEKCAMSPLLVDMVYSAGGSLADYATTAQLLPTIFMITENAAEFKALSMISEWNYWMLEPFVEQICQANVSMSRNCWRDSPLKLVLPGRSFKDLRKSLLTLIKADKISTEWLQFTLEGLLVAPYNPADIETVLCVARKLEKRDYRDWLLNIYEHASTEEMLQCLAEILVHYHLNDIAPIDMENVPDFLTQGFVHGIVSLYPHDARIMMHEIGLACRTLVPEGFPLLPMDDDLCKALDEMLAQDRRGVLRVAQKLGCIEVMEHFALEYDFDCMWDLIITTQGRISGVLKRLRHRPHEIMDVLRKLSGKPLTPCMQHCWRNIKTAVSEYMVRVPLAKAYRDQHVRLAFELIHDMQIFEAEPLCGKLDKLDALHKSDLSKFRYLGHVQKAHQLYAFRVRHPAAALFLLGESMIERVMTTERFLSQWQRMVERGTQGLPDKTLRKMRNELVFTELEARVQWHPDNVNFEKLLSEEHDENSSSAPNSPRRPCKKMRV